VSRVAIDKLRETYIQAIFL